VLEKTDFHCYKWFILRVLRRNCHEFRLGLLATSDITAHADNGNDVNREYNPVDACHGNEPEPVFSMQHTRGQYLLQLGYGLRPEDLATKTDPSFRRHGFLSIESKNNLTSALGR